MPALEKMTLARTVGVLCVTLAVGCTGVAQAPPVEIAQAEPLIVQPAEVTPIPVKAAPPSAGARAKVSAPPATHEQPRGVETPVVAARTLEPSLDLAALKARLRDTNAIGVFTKLALKNQVDDLMQQFRVHYQSGQRTGVDSLRQPYNMLVLKVLSLLQDGDPSLARSISGSREAIWGILADREKFNAAT